MWMIIHIIIFKIQKSASNSIENSYEFFDNALECYIQRIDFCKYQQEIKYRAIGVFIIWKKFVHVKS